MKKTIITCLGVSSIALIGIFYAAQANGGKHNSPVKNPSVAADTGVPSSGDSAVPNAVVTNSGTSPDQAVSHQAPPPLGGPNMPAGTGPSSSDATSNNNSSSQRGSGNANPAAGGAGGPPNEIVQILQSTDMTNPIEREKAVASLTRIEENRMDAVLEKAGQLGVPVRIDEPGGKVSILHDFRGDQPLYRTTNNKNAAISTAANLIQAAPYGLDGTGVKVGVWDAGSIRSTHRELTGRMTNQNPTTPLDDHSTHVAGTIGATGLDPNAKGMAPKATVDSYDWENDYAEMTARGAASPGALGFIPLSNHSYGYGASTADMGRYEKEAQTVDALVSALPYFLPCWAAGNEQDSLTALGGFQSITFNGLAKNILTIGAVNDAVVAGVRSPAAGAMTSFSSWGPCDDGRIKPDLVANGVSVYSTTATSDSSYDGTYSGTSMATPNAAGTAALLEQLYTNTFGQRPRASLLKALLIHTADDLGNPGPDYKFGWGLINAKAAADVILAQKANPSAPRIFENTLTAAVKSTTTTVTWDGVSPLRATLSWTDPAGAAQTAADSRTKNLVHDLDLKITGPDGATVYLPFVMPFVGVWTQASMSAAATTGKNSVDNTEQVLIKNPNRVGNYTVTVSMNGPLTTSGQAYSLVVTGVAAATVNPAPTPTPTPAPSPAPTPTPVPQNPAPAVSLTSPSTGTTVSLGASLTIAASASDLTATGAPGVISRVEFFSGSTSLGVDTTAPYSISWKPAAAGNYTLMARASDNQGAVGVSAPVSVSVQAMIPTPVVSAFSPTSGPAGTNVVITGSNFSAATGVQFNGVPATVWKLISPTQISATVPTGAASGTIRITTATSSATSVAAFTVTTPTGQVVISQIYAGGGRWWSDFSNDYVELYNPGTTAVALDGWSLQLGGGSASSWTVVPLKGSIPAKGYYLIALAGGDYSYDLPKADAVGTYDLAGKQGKVALIRNSVALSGPSPIGLPALADLVGYGWTNAYEGSYPAIAPERYFAIFRAGNGEIDTNDNYEDFDWDYAEPRNSATPVKLRHIQILPRKIR